MKLTFLHDFLQPVNSYTTVNFGKDMTYTVLNLVQSKQGITITVNGYEGITTQQDYIIDVSFEPAFMELWS